MDGSAAICRRWKEILLAVLQPSLEDGAGFSTQEHGSGSSLAVAKPELAPDHFVPTKPDDLVLAAAREKEKPDDVDLAVLRRSGSAGIGMAIKNTMQPVEFLP